MPPRSARGRMAFLSGMCLILALASGFLFLSLSLKMIGAHHGHTKWPGLYMRSAVAEGAVTIDYEHVNEVMQATGTERAIDRETDLSVYLQQRWISPAVRRGIGPALAISFVQTVAFLFLAILFWSDRPPKTAKVPTP